MGNNPFIPPAATPDDNIPMQYDFRSVYTTVLRDWFCMPEADLPAVMLQDFPALPLLNATDCTALVCMK